MLSKTPKKIGVILHAMVQKVVKLNNVSKAMELLP